MGKTKSKLTPEDQDVVFKVQLNMKVKEMTEEQINYTSFVMEKEQYKRKLSAVLKDCKFNGQGMRELLSEFMEESS